MAADWRKGVGTDPDGQSGRPTSQIRLAVARSRVRQDVLKILGDGEPRYVNEIATFGRLGFGNVAGAIRGSGVRYARARSLEVLGLVEAERTTDGRTLYQATRLGRDVAAALTRAHRGASS